MVVPEPHWPGVLGDWVLEPAALLGLLAAAGGYEAAWRVGGPGHTSGERAAFGTGLVVLALALLSPLGTYAEDLLSVHMAQHLLITLVAAPLLLMGRPLAALARVAPGGDRGRGRISGALRWLSHPVVAWTQFAAAGWAIHFSPLFDEALRHPAVHGFEHVVFLASALLFWSPVVTGAAGPRARPALAHPSRLLYLAVAMPQNTFLALALFSSSTVLYGHYSRLVRTWGPSPLADQRQGSGIMWVAGDLALLVSVLLVAAAWARRERIGTPGPSAAENPPGASGPAGRAPSPRRAG